MCWTYIRFENAKSSWYVDDIILKHCCFACHGVFKLQHLWHPFSKCNNEGMMHSKSMPALKECTVLRNYNIYHASREPFAVLKELVKLEYCLSVQGCRRLTQSPLAKSNKCKDPSTWLLITANLSQVSKTSATDVLCHTCSKWSCFCKSL